MEGEFLPVVDNAGENEDDEEEDNFDCIIVMQGIGCDADGILRRSTNDELIALNREEQSRREFTQV